MEINFRQIEKKWQKKWEEKKVFLASDKSKKPRFYVLDMFPYPSGAGLHMGHAFVFSLGDIFARFKRMQGFNVLYPIGYDSLGLPAENAAIKDGTHPRDYTKKSIANFMKQQKAMGWSYDWSRVVNTSDADFYRWDQWIFLQMLKKGIAYRKKASVNWCPKCETVLANEQVVNGRCWRHEDTNVEIKPLEQWFLRITDYAEELLQGLEKLQWSDKAKKLQRNWIGKSFGTEVDFEVENPDVKNEISNVVMVHGSNVNDNDKLAEGFPPQNKRNWFPWVKDELKKKGIKCETPLMPHNGNPVYEEWKREFEKIKIDENSILIGHSAGGAFLVRWLSATNRQIKKLILVAPAYAHGKNINKEIKRLWDFCNFKIDKKIKERVEKIVIFVSDDEKDSIKKSVNIYSSELGIVPIILKNRGHFVQKTPNEKIEFPELLDEIVSNEKFPIFTTRPDTIYGVTFMVISAQHPKLFDLVTKEQKKDVERFLKKLKSVSEKELENLEKEGVFTGSYAINPVTKEKVPIYAGNFVLADYGSGMVMAVPAHDQRDFLFAERYGLEIKPVVLPESILDMQPSPKDKENDFRNKNNVEQILKNIKNEITKGNMCYVRDGVLINSNNFNGLDNQEAKKKITEFLEKKKLGRKKVQYKLRDWLISRQRYWGTPIPVVYCDKCGIVPVSEKDLPVKLPEKVKFGEGNPLLTNEKFVKAKCPKCGRNAKRETDTMDTFANSSWYYLRYCDPKNNKKIFDKKKVNYWCPVDQYIGGPEHITMHLIYVRFYAKFLRDLGILNFDEPALKYFTQGIVHASDGEKMSKSKGNVVEPFGIIDRFGADTLRLALVSFASPENDSIWDEKIVLGSYKFLKKVYDFFVNVKFGKSDAVLESKLNKAIKQITFDVENFKHNLAVIKIRKLFDVLSGKTFDKKTAESFLKLFSIYCPHLAEELWEKIGGKGFIALGLWPVADEKKINDKFEQQEDAIENLIKDLNHIKEIVKDKKKAFVYVLPNEKENYLNNLNLVQTRTELDIEILAVNDKDKHDPENKSKKVKPGRPGIYFE